MGVVSWPDGLTNSGTPGCLASRLNFHDWLENKARIDKATTSDFLKDGLKTNCLPLILPLELPEASAMYWKQKMQAYKSVALIIH
jgi:hypothetical protein